MMDAFEDPSAVSQRSFVDSPVIEPQRVLFDASQLATGPLEGLHDDDSDDVPYGRLLFGEESPVIAPQPPDDGEDVPPFPANEVTVGSGSVGGLIEDDNNHGPVTEEASNRQHDDHSSLLEASLAVAGAPPAKKRRAQVSFARKFFHAPSSLYLALNTQLAPPSSTPDLVGQIISCPTKKNNNLFEVKWIRAVVSTLPQDLCFHLRSFFPKDELRPQLQRLIDNCPDNNTTGLVTQPLVLTPLVLPPTSTNNNPPSVIETPRLSQTAAFAQVYTAGSSVSEISSLGQSISSTPSAQSTSIPSAQSTRTSPHTTLFQLMDIKDLSTKCILTRHVWKYSIRMLASKSGLKVEKANKGLLSTLITQW
jgi:hypothetical protein